MKQVNLVLNNYGVVTVPLPPKKHRTKDNLVQMLYIGIEQTIGLMWDKTVGEFRNAIDVLTPDGLIHKHIFKLSNQQLAGHLIWSCDCGAVTSKNKKHMYSEMTGSVG